MIDNITEENIYFGIGIPELDGDVPYEFVLESDSHYPRDGFHDCRFPVRYVSDRACVMYS